MALLSAPTCYRIDNLLHVCVGIYSWRVFLFFVVCVIGCCYIHDGVGTSNANVDILCAITTVVTLPRVNANISLSFHYILFYSIRIQHSSLSLVLLQHETNIYSIFHSQIIAVVCLTITCDLKWNQQHHQNHPPIVSMKHKSLRLLVIRVKNLYAFAIGRVTRCSPSPPQPSYRLSQTNSSFATPCMLFISIGFAKNLHEKPTKC